MEIGKKTVKVNEPYAIFTLGDWEWRVLKSYQNNDDKPYARWFCAVKSPMTYGSYDLGDVYVSEVKQANRMPDEKMASHLENNKW